MILARYSVKDILASAFQQAHDAVTAAYTLICLSDWRRWRAKFTWHSTPYAPFTAKRYTIVPGAELRLVRYRWHLQQALAAAEVAEPCTARRGDSEGLKTWWRLLPPSLPSHKAHSDIHTADVVRIRGSLRRGCKTIPTDNRTSDKLPLKCS